ncbi:uncharacterized protein LOC133327467 [Musca vetustissima]|uniref:uncharacterized protein LOC133327467 n=1 Tax=Musca vetustissima TaxID=27455 RepID=UPI002AB6D543|nr:uncharacterized protein LOC133327467 [Musca vetustissima]
MGTTKTTIVNRSFDEMGNVMWQQEAAEFVEQFPQRRRPKAAALLLRQSASAGTLYRKPETVIPTLNKRASGGELLTPQHRHQRDLFSGDLGIPDVNSHVGSVVHTFETMALQRQLAERQRIQREREHSKYLMELLAMQAAAAAIAAASSNTAPATIISPATSKRAFITCGNSKSTSKNNTNGNPSKLQQLKKKTQETRQKIVQHILQQNSGVKHSEPNLAAPEQELKQQIRASSNSEVYYRNIDDDYRKNLFGTLSQRKIAPLQETMQVSNTLDSQSYCENSQIVNQAFDEIFEGYSGLEEEEEGEEEREINDNQKNSLVPPTDHQASSCFIQQYGRPGVTPKRLPPLSHKKAAPPPPPPKSHHNPSSSGHIKRKIMPFCESKQRSSTFHNLVERLKTQPQKYTTHFKNLNKTSSDNFLKHDQLPSNSSKFLQKFPPHLHLNREVEGEESPENQDQDFLRGSTLSQSFVRHLKVHKASKGKAPPPPIGLQSQHPQPQQTQSAKHQMKTSEALRQVLLFSRKSKSSGELLPHCDLYSTVEPRKYYRRLEESVERNKERFIDGGNNGMPVNVNRNQQSAEI